MTTITSIEIQNMGTTEYVIFNGSSEFKLPAATPGQPGKLPLQLAISTYTIKAGPLQIGSVEVTPDAKVILSSGNGGLNSTLSVVTTFGPA
ncbi:hypothetical protein E4U55_004271 [Claviceps digitariae]|nr:hypothetical protein E4U55_004271 [Claviceps digitariae]